MYSGKISFAFGGGGFDEGVGFGRLPVETRQARPLEVSMAARNIY